jgi:UDP-3-O-[3-hydroxymyristoyl] glucosamine N-acyltransferase
MTQRLTCFAAGSRSDDEWRAMAQPGPDHSLAEIASAIGGDLQGDGERRVGRIVPPQRATGADDLALAIQPAALDALAASAATAAVVARDAALPDNVTAAIRVQRPRLAMAGLLRLFGRPPHAPAGIHPSACVDATATVAADCAVGPFTYIGPGARIGAGCRILSHVTIGAGAVLGEGCLIHPGARIGERVTLGRRVILQPNACIGADGFSYVTEEPGSIEAARAGAAGSARNDRIVRLDSIGTVVLEDDVEIGAGSTVDRGTLEATRVGRGTKIDNLVQIGHNTTIGCNCLIAGHVGISGSCRIGDRVVLAGKVGVADHVRIDDDAIVMAGSGILQRVAAGAVVMGYPAVPKYEFWTNFLFVRRLKKMAQRLQDIEKKIDERQLRGG